MEKKTEGPHAAIIPGNGCTSSIERCMWYGWAKKKLSEAGIATQLRLMPDPIVARETVWLPFMEAELNCNANCVVIGHSSGAEAAMRYAETHKVLGVVLLAACVTIWAMKMNEQVATILENGTGRLCDKTQRLSFNSDRRMTLLLIFPSNCWCEMV